jgi:flagellar basal-body rod protein FlgC
VKVAGIVEDTQPFQVVHDPTHPDADAEGNVLMPTSRRKRDGGSPDGGRAYQANLAAVNVIRDMVARALELGK